MDRFELVEKLVKSTGVSYQDAKTALEASEWDLLDAAVWLEKNGKIESKTDSFTTNPEQKEQAEQRQQYNESPRGSAETNGTRRSVIRGLLSRIRGILMDNELVICKQNGEIFLEIPIWLTVILLIVAFWPTIIVLVLVFILGLRFRFHGPDLGGETINRILNRAENSAGDFINRLKNQHPDSGPRNENRNDDVIDYDDQNRRE